MLSFLEGRRFSRPHGFWITGSSTPLTDPGFPETAEVVVSPVFSSFEAVLGCPPILLSIIKYLLLINLISVRD